MQNGGNPETEVKYVPKAQGDSLAINAKLSTGKSNGNGEMYVAYRKKSHAV